MGRRTRLACLGGLAPTVLAAGWTFITHMSGAVMTTTDIGDLIGRAVVGLPIGAALGWWLAPSIWPPKAD